MGESKIEEQPFGSIQQTVDMIRSRSIDYLIRQLEVIEYYWVSWCSRHGYANFTVRKPSMVQHPECSCKEKAVEASLGVVSTS